MRTLGIDHRPDHGLGHRLPRCLLVWLLAGVAAVLPAVPAVRVALHGWAVAQREGPDRVPLDTALVALAAAGVVLCAAWGWLAVTVEVLGAAHGRLGSRRGPLRLPDGVRRVVAAACGAALVGAIASPALAHDAGRAQRRHGVAGLPLPERAVARGHRRGPVAGAPTPPSPPTPLRTVVVRPGDSLWTLAAADLPAGASAARVTARWHAVYAANRAVIGPDPDLLEPGQRLHLPGKDRS